MKALVTGSSGHLGEALMRLLPDAGFDPVGIDIAAGPFTTAVGSVADAGFVGDHMTGAEVVFHTATLHKPQVASQPKQAFLDTNVTGTLTLLEAAVATGVSRFIFTSTTSAFGASLRPDADAPAVWIDEDTPSPPKNIYGATKVAAEDLCRLFTYEHGLSAIVLRTSRFFPEDDDDPDMRAQFSSENTKANEYLFRRVDIVDVVSAHIAATHAAPDIGFGSYIISATSPFQRDDLAALRRDAPAVLAARAPGYRAVYDAAGFGMFPSIDRVYDNARARSDLGWQPRYDFARILAQIEAGEPVGDPLVQVIGRKGYRGADAIYGHAG
ncbi:MAG: NAD(P)-dependent oxidoreductase [Pseudomonadota bacterium]